MNMWPFIEAEEAQQGNVKRTCELLEVSRAAFYTHRKNEPSRRAVSDAELTERIIAIHAVSNGTYGAPRIHGQLRDEGVHCGRKRVARLMVRAGLVGRCRRRWRKTTIPDPSAEARAVDLIRREFGPGVELDARWCGDITYIATWEGWAYLATVIDIASRRVVGWAHADHMRTDLVADALRMACTQRRPPAGVIFHSDRGCQYTSGDYTALAADLGVRCRWAGRASAGITRSPRAGSPPSRPSSSTPGRGPPVPVCDGPCSTTSRAGTTPAASTAASATAAPPTTKPPSARRPPLPRHDQHTNPVRQTGSTPLTSASAIDRHFGDSLGAHVRPTVGSARRTS